VIQNLYFNRVKQPLFEREIARSCNILLYNELCNAYTFENIYIFIFLNMLVTIPLKALFLDYQTLYSTAFYKIFQKSKQA
jgi:hypothetical protein